LISCQKKANPASDFEYTENEGKITITGYIRKSKDVVIPRKINNLSVTSIGMYAFSGNQLISVTIPKSVKELRNDVFDEGVQIKME